MISLRNLTVRYGTTTAVDAITMDLRPGKIHGLLGRNGSGKTSLLSVLAAYRKASSGSVTVDGSDPFENPALMRDIVFVRDALDAGEEERVRCILDRHALLRPTWDPGLAAKLTDTFGIDPGKKAGGLSRGQRSSLGVVIGLASRAPITLLDEVHLGMDAAARDAFHRELLADYLTCPRTIILSTHLIQEVADLLEEVIVIDRGRLLMHEDIDTFRSRGVAVTGPAAAVDAFVTGRTVLAERNLGGTRQVTLHGALEAADRQQARQNGLTLSQIGIQDLFVHLTEPSRTPEEVR
ncbi:ABC transporter ATP-binding protein [Actinoplanes sp. N902-109]|uniref:ATP-binding cassette domain-containing protein n=1 Tax=Actinoplanes sp. (strain N902-109) TaxID=649831 RepID=UPI00032965CC|nr:ABC transporter ATP-binding protein [Actinoplanes sp. N902-109]AGL20434.1 ABC transporter [Actinoplanes sp. N902-109]